MLDLNKLWFRIQNLRRIDIRRRSSTVRVVYLPHGAPAKRRSRQPGKYELIMPQTSTSPHD